MLSSTGVKPRLLPEPGGDSVQFVVNSFPLAFLLGSRQDDVRDLQGRHLTRQCEHLVHSDPGSDRCIAQARFSNRFFHATRAQLRNVTQDPDDALFSLAYLCGFAPFHCSDGFSGNVTPFANFVR
jgi:hypothetical protein